MNLPPSRALFVDVEAIDRAGKTTHLSSLAARIGANGWQVVETEYPDRRAPLTGMLIDAFLRERMDLADRGAMRAQGRPDLAKDLEGAFGGMLAATDLTSDDRWRTFEAAQIEADYVMRHALLGQELFCLNRRECAGRLEYLVATADVVLTSRYQLSGRAYGEAAGVPRAQMAALVDSLEPGLRKPDLTLIIDVDAEAVADRPRAGGLDSFERDLELQRRVAEIYRDFAAGDATIVLIDGSGSLDVIGQRVEDAVAHAYPQILRPKIATAQNPSKGAQ